MNDNFLRLGFIAIIVTLIIVFSSCIQRTKEPCKVIESDSVISRIITDLIIGDTLPVCDSLFKQISNNNSFGLLSYLKPKFDKFTKHISLNRPEYDFSYFNNVKPDFTSQDSMDILCQIKSDTLDKYLNINLINVDNLLIMEMEKIKSITLDSLYKKYRQFYSLKQPFFFSNNSKCIVDVRFHCGPLCGTFWVYLMEKSKDKWIIIRKAYYGCK